VARADLVVTGEGYFDRQSFVGKAVGGVLDLADRAGVPVLVVAGQGEPGIDAPYVSLVDRFGVDKAMENTADCVTEVVEGQLARGLPG
jgi:glycerate kinase